MLVAVVAAGCGRAKAPDETVESDAPVLVHVAKAGPATPKWPRETATGGGVFCWTNAGACGALASARTSIACVETRPPSANAVERTTVHPRPGTPGMGSVRDAQVPTGLSLVPSGHQLVYPGAEAHCTQAEDHSFAGHPEPAAV
jgi:hypothetical protein